MRNVMMIILLFIVFRFSADAEKMKFYNVNDIFGISMRETASVVKDDNGFIWTSSKTGILRIAGNNCRLYQLPLKKLNVLNIRLVCENSRLIAYSNNGQVFRYDPVYDRFDYLFDLDDMLEAQNHLVVLSFLIDQKGDFWITTSSGFHVYRQGKLININADLKGDTRLCFYNCDSVLFTCSESIGMVNINNMESKTVYRNERTLIFQVSSLYYDPTADRLWIGALSDGLFYYDFTEGFFSGISVPSLPKQPILDIEFASDTTFYVGIDGQGIWEIDKRGDRIVNTYKENPEDKSSIRGNGIYDIMNDTESQRVWVCTYSGGLSYFEQIPPSVIHLTHEFNNANSLVNDNVNQIIEDSRGNLWFATDNGISCWNRDMNKWQTYYRNTQEHAQVFLSLCEDDRHRIWAGTYSSGVYVLDGSTGRQLAHYSGNEKNSLFDSNFNYDILRDKKGHLWLTGINEKIFRYDPVGNTFKAGPVVAIYNMAELSENEILASSPAGLYLIEKETMQDTLLLGKYLIMDVLVSSEYVWMCTQGNGMVTYDLHSKTTREYTTESGLPSNCVNSIISGDGYLWLGTESGLCRYNPADNSIISYSHLLPQVSFNRNAVCRLRNGQLAWGTNKGVLIFDPVSLQKTPPRGRIFVQDILVSGYSIRDNEVFKLKKPVDSLQEITLGYNQNNIVMELLPLGNASDYKFSWILEGFDAQPSRPSDDRKLMYTNIPTGRYVLNIFMYDYSLSLLMAERRLIIRITPPFWETWWFRLILTMITAGIIYFTLRFYVNRLKRQHTEDKVRFFTHMAHEIRTMVTLIKAPIEELSGKNFHDTDQYYLNLAAEQAGRLSSKVTDLLDFQKADIGKGQLSLTIVNVIDLIEHRQLMFESLAKSKNINLIFTAEPASYLTAIDVPKMEKVIDNLISNAIKYSYSGSDVHMLFTGSGKKWTFEVKDYGIGVSRKAQRRLFKEFYRSENAILANTVGSGIGLMTAKNYVTLHGGAIRCVSRENVGSSFKIEIPFKQFSIPEIPSMNQILPVTEIKEAMQLKDGFSKKMRILVADDNEDLQNFMKHALMDEYDVVTAGDGVIAWDHIRKQLPDIVVSDVMMPVMDGFELCRLIKSTFETSHIPVVLLTSLTGKAEQLHGLGLGADNYLAKPFDMAIVKQRIRSIIQNRKIVRDKALKLIETNEDKTLFTNELNDKFLKKAVEVVQKNIANTEFDKEEFASAMNVSSSLLYKKVKSLTDRSPVDFIKAIRLNHAMQLMQKHKFSITEVSEMCGFSSISYFSKTFKLYFGKAPSDI